MANNIGNFKVIDNSGKVLQLAEQAKGKALLKIGEAWDQRAPDKVPVKTGYLRDHRGFIVDNNEVTVGFTAEYSSCVELGTRYQRAQPYLRPSIEQNLGVFKSITEDAYKNT